MFCEYFEDWRVKSEFSKEYVSLWDGWLGDENYHKLDEVTEEEWSRFNDLLRNLAKAFALEVVDFDNQSTRRINDIDSVLSSYTDSMNKDSSMFINLIVPELGCVISEEWDYTYIVWHKNNGAVEALTPYIENSKLKHFRD